MYQIEPIGFFEAEEKEKYSVSRQPGLLKQNFGKIVLNPRSNFEQALDDLEGFSHIFVIYRFHRNHTWKPKVMPPRGIKKRGVFATRAPHRPNFLGLSCVELIKIEGLNLYVANHDLLDGTPILDIKPYLTYADSFPEAKQGWLEELEKEPLFDIGFMPGVKEKLDQMKEGEDILANITPRLKLYPYPREQNRIRLLENGFYEIAYKAWRISYSLSLDPSTVWIQSFISQDALNQL